MTPTARRKVDRQPPSPSNTSDDFELRRFTVDEYHRLVEVGILHSGDPYELLDGWIVRKMPKNPPHVRTTMRISEGIKKFVPLSHIVRVGFPITLEASEPEPDVVVAIGPDELYDERHPYPVEIELVVEVSDATLNRYKRLKLPLYAKAKLPIYWIINIPERQIEVYTEPRGGKTPTYRRRTDYGIDDVIPVILDGENRGSITVRGILPK